ncbi:hypothetical protein M413DRAFT_14595 [Hebeloma cylindrosporum]|uniref:Uncharacterized protein n=1 Tax=Hebeloma cylindrosporum TaxID=76867 RepID=A0A0C2Y2P3_HEBCY|nr:hypothetical protein M413DRAFT_14595 [Hebeloma cylindrosporum h7]
MPSSHPTLIRKPFLKTLHHSRTTIPGALHCIKARREAANYGKWENGGSRRGAWEVVELALLVRWSRRIGFRKETRCRRVGVAEGIVSQRAGKLYDWLGNRPRWKRQVFDTT